MVVLLMHLEIGLPGALARSISNSSPLTYNGRSEQCQIDMIENQM